MEKLYKKDDLEIELEIGDIVEVSEGVFMKITEIKNITEEIIAGTKKTNVYIKGEIISNGKEKQVNRLKSTRNC